MAPDLRKRVDEQRAQRLALEASMKNQNAAVVRLNYCFPPARYHLSVSLVVAEIMHRCYISYVQVADYLPSCV